MREAILRTIPSRITDEFIQLTGDVGGFLQAQPALQRQCISSTQILRDGAKAGDWSVKSADAAAGMVLNATSRFHHPVMVQLDGGRSDLKELDALMDVLIAGLQARG